MKLSYLMIFYSKYKLFLFPTVVALSCLVLIAFIIFPQLSKLISNKEVEKQLAGRAKVLGIKAAALEGYNSEELQLKVVSVLSALPPEKDLGSILSILQNITGKDNFTISAFSVAGGEGVGGVQSYGVKLTVAGPRSLFSSLLKSIESSPRIMRVQTIDVSGTKDAQSLEANLSIQILFAPIPSSMGSVDAPLPTLSEKDEEVIAKLSSTSAPIVTTEQTPIISVPTGKANPFE